MKWNGPLRCRKFKNTKRFSSCQFALISQADMGHCFFANSFSPFFTEPITRQQIFDKFKQKQLVDDNLKFDENSRQFSSWIESTVGKGEIACYEQFLLFSQCFQMACFPGESKGVIVWEWVTTQCRILMH